MYRESQPTKNKVILTAIDLEGFRKYLEGERKRPETIKSYIIRATQFRKLIGKEPSKINKNGITKWKSYCSKYHNNSLTPMYGAIKKYITYLAEEEIVDATLESIVRRKLKAPKLQHDEDNIDRLVLKPEQFNRIFEVAKKRNYMHYAVFKTMFWGMARRCDIIGLRISDIDFENKKITFTEQHAKGVKRATVNLAQECLDILREYIDTVRPKPKKEIYKDVLFLRNEHPLSKTKMWEMRRVYSEASDIDIHSHMWRHTGIKEYAKVEKDVKLVQKQARHDDVNITMRYINYAKGVYDKSYHEKFARSEPEIKVKSERPSKPIKPRPPEQLYANIPQDPRDTMIPELKREVDKLKQQLNNQNLGYQ